MELPPVATLPKLTEVALGVSNPVLGGWLFAALVSPTQLVKPITEESVARVAKRAKTPRNVVVPETLLSSVPMG